MKLIISTLLVLYTTLIATAETAKIYTIPQDIEIYAEFYDKPLHIVKNKLQGPEKTPDWYPAFIATRNFIELGYDKLSNLLADDYQELIGLTEELYNSSLAGSSTEDIDLEISSILSKVHLKYEEREFLFIGHYDFKLLEEYKESQDLEYATFTVILEKFESGWKRQHLVNTVKWLQSFASLSREDLSKILQDGTFKHLEVGLIVPQD